MHGIIWWGRNDGGASACTHVPSVATQGLRDPTFYDAIHWCFFPDQV